MKEKKKIYSVVVVCILLVCAAIALGTVNGRKEISEDAVLVNMKELEFSGRGKDILLV